MKKTNFVCYYTDTHIYFYSFKQNKYFIESLIDCVYQSKIIDIDLFYSQIEKNFKQNKITNNLIASNIIIITPPNNTKTDDYILLNIFEKLGFNKIKLKKESELLNIKSNQAIINIQKDYFIYYYLSKNKKLKNIILPYSIFIDKKNIQIANSIIRYNLKLNITKNYFFGYEKLINYTISKIEEKSSTICYLYEQENCFMIDYFIYENTN